MRCCRNQINIEQAYASWAFEPRSSCILLSAFQLQLLLTLSYQLSCCYRHKPPALKGSVQHWIVNWDGPQGMCMGWLTDSIFRLTNESTYVAATKTCRVFELDWVARSLSASKKRIPLKHTISYRPKQASLSDDSPCMKPVWRATRKFGNFAAAKYTGTNARQHRSGSR